MSNQVNSLKKGLTVKDLVTTGIFSAIFFVFTLVGGLPFAPNPVLTFYMPMGAALLCGPIYLLMVAKVQKRWSVTILGIIMGIIWFATGMHWAFSLGYIGMGLIADLVAGVGHYRNKAINLLSYIRQKISLRMAFLLSSTVATSCGSSGSVVVFTAYTASTSGHTAREPDISSSS